MSFYGVALNGAAQTVLGPAGATCSYIVGGDGSTYITVAGSEASLYETYLPGGIEIIAGDLCGAFPDLASAVNGQLSNIGSVPICATGGVSTLHKLSTGLSVPDLEAGIRKISAGSDSSLARYLPASSHYTTWQLYFGNVEVPKGGAGTYLDYKSIACAAAPSELKICTASLEYFIAGLISQSGYGKPNLSGLYAAIVGYISR